MTLAEKNLSPLRVGMPNSQDVDKNLTKLCEILRAEGFTYDCQIIVLKDGSALIRRYGREHYADHPSWSIWQPLTQEEFYRIFRKIIKRVDKALERLIEYESAERKGV